MGLSGTNINNSMGYNGSIYINDTIAHSGDFSCIQFTEESVLAAYNGTMDNSSALITDTTPFTQGQALYGPFTTVRLASGAAILYRK